MKRCAIYARYSTDKQDVQSIDTQLMMCRREVARAGWQEVLCFTDAAESAATMHRPGMKALLAAVAAGAVGSEVERIAAMIVEARDITVEAGRRALNIVRAERPAASRPTRASDAPVAVTADS